MMWIISWAFLIFINIADCELLFRLSPMLPVISITVVMILRVYAMWNRSKWILYLLLFIYVPQVIVTFVMSGLFNTSTYLSGTSRITFACHYNLTRSSHAIPSHNYSGLAFLFLQCLMEQYIIHDQRVVGSPAICSWCYASYSCSHSNLEAIS